MTIATAARDQWIIASESKPGTLYIVKRHAGAYSCDCQGHYHHGHCKHADAVKASQPTPAMTGPSAEATAAIFMAHRTPRNA